MKNIFYSITIVALVRLVIFTLVGSALVLLTNKFFESMLLSSILVIALGISIILYGRKAKKKHDFNILALKKIGETIVGLETVNFKETAIQGGALINEHTYAVYVLPTKKGIKFIFPSYNLNEIILVKWEVIETVNHCFYHHKDSSYPLIKATFNCSNIEFYIPWVIEFNKTIPDNVRTV